MLASVILRLCVGSRASCHFSGNAKVAGMADDLQLVGLRYNIAAAVFFVRFSLFVFLKHDQRVLRCFTVSGKSRRKSEQHILILGTNLCAQKYHPQAVPTLQMEYGHYFSHVAFSSK